MFALNLRQKMIGCFILHLSFYVIVGVTFLKDFKIFGDDVTLLMHAGRLSNICLEIRRYEKNYIIRQDERDFNTALDYINEALTFVPRVVSELKIMQSPVHLKTLTENLKIYKTSLHRYKSECGSSINDEGCPSRKELRVVGQELVTITEDLVQFEQTKMGEFIENFKTLVLETSSFLVILSIFTILLLYRAIVIPLKSVENAAISIAEGTFSQLPVDNKKGEVRSVLRAFNKMSNDLAEQQEQLFQAKKLSSIGTLASGTAHQINNPLNNISTSCQLALSELEGKDFPFAVKMLETINQETQRAGEIVKGLLEFSRAQTFSMQPYPLAEVVQKVKLLVASEVPAAVTLVTKIPEDIVLFIDVQKLVEALLNLTINAIQAIPKPPGLITIDAERDATNTNAIITVADTGTGIDKEDLQKVFDPFFTTKNAENGTGLGLAVVYGIIKKQNGSIRIESEKDKWTKFIITLPLYVEPDNSTSHKP